MVKTQVIIGTTVILLGLGVMALGFMEDEARVRQVADVLADPDGHNAGPYTLIGIPQPPQLHKLDVREANPQWRNSTTWHEAWGGLHSTHTIAVSFDGASSIWTHTNRTQEPGRPETATQTHATWRIDHAHTVFLIQGFPDKNGDTPWLWGVYEGILREPVQPKPSQFEGHLTDRIDGQGLPDGALVYDITEFTAGCSSKFLPDDHDVV